MRLPYFAALLTLAGRTLSQRWKASPRKWRRATSGPGRNWRKSPPLRAPSSGTRGSNRRGPWSTWDSRRWSGDLVSSGIVCRLKDWRVRVVIHALYSDFFYLNPSKHVNKVVQDIYSNTYLYNENSVRLNSFMNYRNIETIELT